MSEIRDVGESIARAIRELARAEERKSKAIIIAGCMQAAATLDSGCRDATFRSLVDECMRKW